MTKMVLAGPRSTPERVAELGKLYPSVDFVVPPTREDVISVVGDAEAFYGSLRNEEFLAARKLRWVQSPGAGVEWLWQIPTIAESDVVVTNMRGAHAATIAEHAFGMLLCLTRALRDLDEHQKREEWARGLIADRLFGIKGLTMGIVGFGNIGRAIAGRASGFEMNVIAVDAQSVAPENGVKEVWPLALLNDLCRQTDVLVISAPITPQTRGLIGSEQIGLLKEGAYLLAVSRGGIVDEPALIEALQSAKLAGAGLDVTATEPLPAGDPLWRAPNLVITPHTSAASRLTSELVWSILTENIGHFLNGEPLINVVDKRLGY